MAIATETFFLDPDARGTLQAQIQQMVAEGILSGRFRPGDRLPSSRALARHLGVSRITVTLAYTELVASDYIAAHGRSGYYVSESAPQPPAFKPTPSTDRVDWSRVLGQRFADSGGIDRPADWKTYRYPFIYGQVDAELFDHAAWRHCALKALGGREFDALTSDLYDSDDPELVDFILRHTLPRRGIAARPEEVLVTMGAQNALWLAAQVLLTQRRTAAFEEPGYPSLLAILRQTRCHLAPIAVDAHGLPPEAIPRETDVVFTTPSHQCPTGATMPVARRRALLDRAVADDMLIVEDDYESEMPAGGGPAPAPALKALDQAGVVVYAGSFSKSIFPGLRLGYLVGAAPFIREARALRAAVLRHPPGQLQRTTAFFLALGHYDALIRRTAQALSERRATLHAALAATGLEIAGTGASALWMRAPDGVDPGALARDLRHDGVLIEPGHAFFTRPAPPPHYRLAYSSIPVSRISEGVRRIAAAMDQHHAHT